MKMKKIAALICAASLSLLTACGDKAQSPQQSTDEQQNSESSVSSTEEEYDMNKETFYKPDAENVKLLGRTHYADDWLYCALSGTGVEFTFTGTKCTMFVTGDGNSANAGMADDQARIGIYVNGERVIDDMVDNKQETYEVFESDEPQEVTVTFVKLSESPMSTIALTGINVAGTPIKPAPEKEKLIEFIGDSITCGYGADDPDKDHHFSTKTEDVTKAFAYKTAQALGADYSMVSFSGYGIISGYSDGTKKVPEQSLPQYYTKLGYSWAANGSFKPSEIDWDFSKRRPDIVVINLGTNDDSYTLTHKDRQEEYSAAYTEFLKTVRENNPEAKIVCAFGVMTDRLFPYVEQAVENYTAETGDSNISTLKFDVQTAADGFSADWHPSIATHDKAAAKLTEYLKTLL